MSFRYIGSKARLVKSISHQISKWGGNGRFVDAFCGTGAVSEAAVDAGWPVHLNDNLACATTMSAARFVANGQARFEKLGGYAAAIATLNNLAPQQGFIWAEYSPASLRRAGIERRYFREENAGRVDAVRSTIRAWRQLGLVSAIEERLLIADLLSAVSRVSNIAGTYGCFMSKWTPQAEDPIELRPRTLRKIPVNVRVTTQEVSSLLVEPRDLVYLDPPYTKRQYAAYYHLLETITIGDTPRVEGITGLRPWRDRASAFCYKARALGALGDLIRALKAQRILLSYSDEGHVSITELREALRDIGRISCHVVKEIGRYRPNHVASLSASGVREYLFVIDRDDAPAQQVLTA